MVAKQEDVLDHVLLTPRAVRAYREHVERVVSQIQTPPTTVGLEKAEVVEDGRLRIWVDGVPESEFFISPRDWAWRNAN
jgi:hypothetical protein